MTQELLNIVLGLIGFILFVIIQALIINGIKEAMNEGMILEKLGKRLKEVLGEYWFAPFGGCIRCMSSVYGAITYWPVVLYLFGFHWPEIPVFIADTFCLVIVNWIIYKKQ